MARRKFLVVGEARHDKYLPLSYSEPSSFSQALCQINGHYWSYLC